MLPSQKYPFGQWLPDFPAFPNAGAIEVKNCIPQADSYREFRDFLATTDAVGSAIVGGIWNTDAAGNVEIIVGTATNLYRLSGASWTSVGSGYTGVTKWEFANFGTNIIAVAAGVDPQIIDLGAGSPAFSAITGSPSNPPRARRVAQVQDFIVLGDTDNDPKLIQWSGYNNANVWDANGNVTAQADSQRLFEGGVVQKIVGGPYGLIFQENTIRLMRYVGAGVVFSLNPLDWARGTPAPDSVITSGDKVFFYGQDGFFALNGLQPQPIGRERVNRWFRDNAASEEIINMKGATDRTNELAVWAFKSNASATLNDRILMYHWGVDRWAYAEVETGELFEARSVGYTLDNLDTLIPDVSQSEALIDAAVFKGGSLGLYGTSTTGAIGTFEGAPLTATIDTAEFTGDANMRLRINNVRPFVHGSPSTSITVQLGCRNLLTEVPNFSAPRGLNSAGEAPISTNARYHRVRVNIEGGFDHAVAVDVLAKVSGRF